jgi:phenylacetic acid degradation operon negative regulatory protein
MKWTDFHHPDISFPVLRRRLGMELMELLQVSGLFMARGGWAVMNRSCYPNRKLYREATYRLRDKGLLIRTEGVETPILTLTDEGADLLPDYFNPERFWERKWNGIWYLLVYDVPESDRKYRDILRQFLKRMHLGCLQQSVWVTPVDIRPDYDDLVKGAAVDAFAYLFEARTVLGLPNRRVVDDAWNFDQLYDRQKHYCDVMSENLLKLQAGPVEFDDLATLMRVSLSGFHSAFADDPLLPRSLWPVDYQGEYAFGLHRRLFEQIDLMIESA